MNMSSITGLLSVFGFVLFLGLALVVESVAKELHRRKMTMHKLKFEFYSLKENLLKKLKR